MTIPPKPSLLLFISALCLIACARPQANTATVARNDVGRSDNSKNLNVRAQSSAAATTPTPELNIAFAKGLRIVPISVKLENQRRRYKIDVVYPQVEGSKRPAILTLNRRIKNLAAEQYHWLLNSDEPLTHSLYKYPDVFNTVEMTYVVPLATDELLSVYLDCYTYGVGAAHSVQRGLTVNYDLRSGRLLKLTDIFDRRKNYLQFISQHCSDELAKRHGGNRLFEEALAPKAKNFESWNITKEGIRINFDACTIMGCAGGQEEVTIPFSEMKDVFNPHSPVSSLTK